MQINLEISKKMLYYTISYPDAAADYSLITSRASCSWL